jgi:hypothetical protein
MSMRKLKKMHKLVRLLGKVWIRLEVAIGDLIEETENGERENRVLPTDRD